MRLEGREYASEIRAVSGAFLEDLTKPGDNQLITHSASEMPVDGGFRRLLVFQFLAPYMKAYNSR